MNLNLPPELEELSRSVSLLLESKDHAHVKFGTNGPSIDDRKSLIDALSQLVLNDLDIGLDFQNGLAAAQVVRACGTVAAAVPVVPLVLRRAAKFPGLLSAVNPNRAFTLINHVDLGLPVATLSTDGDLRMALPSVFTEHEQQLAPFAAKVELGSVVDHADSWLWPLSIILSAFNALGACEGALSLTRQHICNRVQFGRTLDAFQGNRNRIANMVLWIHSLRELALWTLWRAYTSQESATMDALILRRVQLSAVHDVFSDAHQLHGALGFCYEYPLASLTVSQLVDRYEPLTESECLDWLCDQYESIELHYETLPTPWPLRRNNSVRNVS